MITGALLQTLLLDALCSAVAAVGFAAISNPPKHALLFAALLAAFGHALRTYLISGFDVGLITATLVSSLTVGTVSIFFAAIVRCPIEVFTFPALLPMVPGIYAYRTILALMRFLDTHDPVKVQNLITEILRNGLTTLFILAALVIGVAFPLLLFHRQASGTTRPTTLPPLPENESDEPRLP